MKEWENYFVLASAFFGQFFGSKITTVGPNLSAPVANQTPRAPCHQKISPEPIPPFRFITLGWVGFYPLSPVQSWMRNLGAPA
jgi:hypothetical protein